MDLGIEGRVALVLGASKGIGRAVATELAAEGARVAIASRSREGLDELAGQIGATAFEHDNADLDRVPELIEAVTQALGQIDVLVTNTGGPPASADPLAQSREEWEAAYRTLVLAPLALVRAVLPGMRERGFGRIVNIGSWTVREPLPNLMLSNSHRSATFAAFKTISSEVAGSGVTLNTVLPGRIATALGALKTPFSSTTGAAIWQNEIWSQSGFSGCTKPSCSLAALVIFMPHSASSRASSGVREKPSACASTITKLSPP